MSNDRVNGRLVRNDFNKLKKFCSEDSINHLKQSLRSLEKGRPATISFPLYGKRDSTNLKKWISILEKLSLPDWLMEYEKSRISKFGPQGGVPEWKELEPIFMQYMTAPKPVRYVDDSILNDMKREYSKLHCRLFGVMEALSHLKHTDKIETRAAGWNTFQLKKNDPEAQRAAVNMVKSGNWKYGVGYTFARFNKQKLRIFMPMPFSSMLKQAQYYISFLANIQQDLLAKRAKSAFSVWADKIGFEKCFAIMGEEIKQSQLASDECLIYFSNDFEKMDTRTASSQYDAFVVPIIGAAHHSVSPDLREAMMFTTTAPIYSPSGTIVGNHGTASGAEVTNGGETIGNDYFQRRFLKILGTKLQRGWRLLSRRANGDDSALIFALKTSVSKDVFKKHLMDSLEQACSETGWDIQFDKLDISDVYGKYCQNVYYYDRDAQTINWMYPTVLVLNSILNPEHQYTPKQWDKDYRDLDIIVKLDNAQRHPAYHELVDFIQGGTKYPLLGKSENETKRILSKYEGYRALQTLGERYNRIDYSIDVSPTVKYIIDKRR